MIKRFYTAFTIYIMVMLYTPPVYSINFFFSHLGVEDGLSQVSVLDIFQDSDGYIWFGTRNGANRYDGYEFVVYQNEVNNNATLTDNYIRGFAEDNRKNIWIATSNGINCIDYNLNSAVFFLVRKFYMLRCLLGALYFDMRRFGVFWVFSKHKIPRPNQWGSMKNHKK